MTIGGLFGTTAALDTASAAPPAPDPGGAAAKLAESTTVKVPGENSKTFASTLAGNTTEQSENEKWVPLDAATRPS